MARRRDLKNVSYGFLGFVFSRNFDVDGYCGLGKLYQLANGLEGKVVHLDVMPDPQGHCGSLVSYSEFFSYWLGQKMNKLDLPLDWVTSAELTIRFNVPPDLPLKVSKNLQVNAEYAVGDIVTAELVLISDFGKEYTASANGRCVKFNSLLNSSLRRGREDRGPKLKKLGALHLPKVRR